MAHIARSVEVDAPVDTIHKEWLRFEERPRCAAHALHDNLKWRAEVLTLEPIPRGTRITLKLEYDPCEGAAALPRRLEAVLQSFTAFFERTRAPVAAQAQPA